MSRTYASVYSLDGNELTSGLEVSKNSSQAIQIAQRWADNRGEDVELLDDDGAWLVHPANEDGSREAADPIEDNENCDR